MHPRERTVQHNGHKCHAAIPSLEKLKQQKFDRFFSQLLLKYKLCYLVSGNYCPTLPTHSRSERSQQLPGTCDSQSAVMF